MKMRRRIFSLLIPLLAAVFCLNAPQALFAAQESQKRVFDDAGLFTSKEAAELETGIKTFREESGIDMAVLTIDDAEGMDSKEYADVFYVKAGLGSGKKGDGVLCVLDMDNRTYYVYTYGIMMRYLTDSRLTQIVDGAYSGMKSGKYGDAAKYMVDEITEYVEQGIEAGQFLFDEQTGKVSYYRKRSITWYEFLFALAGAGLLAGLPCLSVVKQYGMEKERRQAQNYYMAYRGSSGFAYQLNEEHFIDKSVTKRRIQSSAGSGKGGGGPRGGSSAGRSTVHRSSSGRSHGGKGRSF